MILRLFLTNKLHDFINLINFINFELHGFLVDKIERKLLMKEIV